MIENETLKYILAFVCSGAFVGFVQFLIQRHDNQKGRLDELEQKFTEGLNLREMTGKARYDEHKEAIEELRKAIISLSESTIETQKITSAVGELVVGLGQDKLVYLTDKYRARGAITLKEKAGLKALYIPYHEKLDGNGYGTLGYEYCMEKLPLISDEEAMELDKGGNRYGS